MSTSTSTGVRVAAGSLALTAASLIGAAAGGAAIFVTISRVGWHKTRLPDRLVQLGTWIVFSWPAIGTLNPATTWGMRAVTVPLAIAALVVALSHPRRHSPRHAPAQRRALRRLTTR